jgi:HEPN domain-containing protein
MLATLAASCFLDHEMFDRNNREALFLCRNASSFLDASRRALVTDDDGDQRIYFVAISIELSLKAYLRRAGMTDEETRRLVRHDLFKASRLAAALGLDLIQPTHTAIIHSIGRRYGNGGFRRLPAVCWPSHFVATASLHAADLNQRVRTCLVA